jgi:hypothetical protein
MLRSLFTHYSKIICITVVIKMFSLNKLTKRKYYSYFANQISNQKVQIIENAQLRKSVKVILIYTWIFSVITNVELLKLLQPF